MALNFAVSILERKTMISNKNVVGRMPYLFCIDELEAMDIDSELDFAFSEFVYQKIKHHI